MQDDETGAGPGPEDEPAGVGAEGEPVDLAAEGASDVVGFGPPEDGPRPRRRAASPRPPFRR